MIVVPDTLQRRSRHYRSGTLPGGFTPLPDTTDKESCNAEADVLIAARTAACVARSAKMRMHPSVYPVFGLVQMIIEPQLLAKTFGAEHLPGKAQCEAVENMC